MTKAKPKEGNLLSDLEKAIRQVLNDPDATVGERVQAIRAGTAIATARHKIDGGDEGGGFFGN